MAKEGEVIDAAWSVAGDGAPGTPGAKSPDPGSTKPHDPSAWIDHPKLFRAADPRGALARGLAAALQGVGTNPLLQSAAVAMYRLLLKGRLRVVETGALPGAVAIHTRQEQAALDALRPGELDRLVVRAWRHANGR